MVAGTVPELFTLEQWRALARRAGFDVRRLIALPEISLSLRSLERLFESAVCRAAIALSGFMVCGRDARLHRSDRRKQ